MILKSKTSPSYVYTHLFMTTPVLFVVLDFGEGLVSTPSFHKTLDSSHKQPESIFRFEKQSSLRRSILLLQSNLYVNANFLIVADKKPIQEDAS